MNDDIALLHMEERFSFAREFKGDDFKRREIRNDLMYALFFDR